MLHIVAAAMALTMGADLRLSPTPGPAADAFARLRSLAGEWEGTYQWSGGRTESGSLSATYAVTGMGSAVMETLIMNGVPSMTTVYHLDGSDLRMTHYCGAQNQPRLKAERIDLDSATIQFAFVDITNLASPIAGHVDGFHLKLIDADQIALDFRFVAGGKESNERITLKRLRSKPS